MTHKPHHRGDSMRSYLTGGYDTARVTLPAGQAEQQRRAQRAERARRNLAVMAMDRHPGDHDAARAWLHEIAAALGLLGQTAGSGRKLGRPFNA